MILCINWTIAVHVGGGVRKGEPYVLASGKKVNEIDRETINEKIKTLGRFTTSLYPIDSYVTLNVVISNSWE